MRTHTCKWVMLMLLLVTPLAQAGTKHYYYTDPQGTVLAKADAQGNIVATYDYAPYGAQVLGTPPSGPAGYTGHVNDAESGLVYMQQRYYDPLTGRFLSVDPIGSNPGSIYSFARYSYGSNNPILNIDPDGKQDISYTVVTLRDGSKVTVPSAYAHYTILADATNSTSSDYSNPSFDKVAAAEGLDNAQMAGTALTIATAADFPPLAAGSGVLSEVSGVLAFLMDPTPTRGVNVLTMGTFGGLKILVHESSDALKTVEKMRNASDGSDILNWTQDKLDRQRQKAQEEQRKREQEQNTEQRE